MTSTKQISPFAASGLMVAATFCVISTSHTTAAIAAPPGQVAPHVRSSLSPARWGVGLRASAQSVQDAKNAEATPVELSGIGVHLRYRLHPHWELELSLEHAEGELPESNAVRRSDGATFSVLYRMRPAERWDWFLLAGLGGSKEQVVRGAKGGQEIAETFQQTHLQLGGGLERQFHRISIGVELRIVTAAIDDTKDDARAYTLAMTQPPIAFESSGARLDLTATYHF